MRRREVPAGIKALVARLPRDHYAILPLRRRRRYVVVAYSKASHRLQPVATIKVLSEYRLRLTMKKGEHLDDYPMLWLFFDLYRKES